MSPEHNNSTVGPDSKAEQNYLNIIILEAIEGNLSSQRELSSKISLKLRSYIYRSTLDDNLTDDILQETMLIMIDKIGSLKKPEAFWGWIFKIASNCIIDHYRQNARRKKLVSFQDIMIEKAASDDSSPEARLMTRELSDTIRQAVSMLKPRQRQTISLRCFEDMSFREIGTILNISEVSARVDFHRGLEKIRLSLKKQGFSKASLALALTFFGKITAHSEAAASAVSVTGTSLAAAKSASIISGPAIKIFCSATANPVKSAIVALLIFTSGIISAFYFNSRNNVTSVHYNVQGLYRLENKHNQNIYNNSLSLSKSRLKSSWEYGCKGFYEQKIFMPEGPDGPILRFMFRIGMPEKSRLCRWLQDGNANYYYESGSKQMYITNDPLRMLILPTDPPAMMDFIYEQIGTDSRLKYNRGFFSRVVNSTIDNRTKDYNNLIFEYNYNTLDINSLTTDWPQKPEKIIDQRDLMHKRGWTYFDIKGSINNKTLAGFGRLPFVYNKYNNYKPYFYLEIGKDIYIDYENAPASISTDGNYRYYQDNSLFTCLPRPWTGFAFVDSVCRDAARYKIPFEIVSESDTDAIVRILPFPENNLSYLVFDIDRYNDIIRSIKFYSSGKEVGCMIFSYHQDITNLEEKYIMPLPEQTSNNSNKTPRELWLKNLID